MSLQKMSGTFKLFVAFVVFSQWSLVRGDESLLQIVLKQPVNVVSDEFVSLAVDTVDVVDLPDTAMKRVSSMVTAFRPAYLKITGTKHTIGGHSDKGVAGINSDLLGPFINWLDSLGVTTVYTLPYSTSSLWTPRDIIRVLGDAKAAGATDCIWQLGAELNTSDPIGYVDDLATLRHISDAIGGPNWGVIGADISTTNHADEARFYIELSQHIVESTGWTKSSRELTSIDRNQLMQGTTENTLHFSHRPLWLNMPTQRVAYSSQDSTTTQGLKWAVTLGTSAQQGFAVVFQRIAERDIFNPKLASFVSLLHKQLMGNQVFETRMIPGAGRKDHRQMFAHCTRNVSGSITVMGVNLGTHAERVSTKLPIKSSGTTVLQYVLETNTKGNVLCNGVPVQLNSQIKPVSRSKKPNRPTSFMLPAMSVAFWVLPDANVKSCLETPAHVLNASARSRTSSEKLLEQLITESVSTNTVHSTARNKRHLVVKKDIETKAHDSKRHKRSIFPVDMKSQFRMAKRRNSLLPSHASRNKRQLAPKMNRLFDKFELRNPKKFQLPSLFHKGALTIPPVVSNIHDVYKVDAIENVFKSSENHDLPDGDVFLEVGDNNEQDYVEFDEPNQPNQPQPRFDEFPETPDYRGEPLRPINHLFEVFPGEASPKALFKTVNGAGSWEVGSYSAPIVGEHDDLNHVDIVKQVEPTWEENQRHLQRAKQELENMYIEDGLQQTDDYRRSSDLAYNELDSAESFFTT